MVIPPKGQTPATTSAVAARPTRPRAATPATQEQVGLLRDRIQGVLDRDPRGHDKGAKILTQWMQQAARIKKPA